jgi:hypothetical protein
MPKNMQGGSKHKKGSNSESSTSKKNKKLFDNLLSDVYDGDDIDGIHIGKVMRKMGDGRMEVDFIAEDRLTTVSARMKGSIRGRGKKDAWIDVGSFVVLNHTGVEGSLAYEIVMPLNPQQVSTLKKEDLIHEHLCKEDKTKQSDGIEFETPAPVEPAPEAEINIDNI